MNCRVRADFPTPPLPTMITLCKARELWFLPLLVAMSGAISRASFTHLQTHPHTRAYNRVPSHSHNTCEEENGKHQ